MLFGDMARICFPCGTRFHTMPPDPMGAKDSRLKLAIVEAEPAARLGVSYFLAQYPRIEVILEIESAARGEMLFGSVHPDVVLVDADLDGGGGLELIRRVQHAPNGIPCIAWLHRNRPQDVMAAFKIGARGIVCRREPLSEIVLAVLV